MAKRGTATEVDEDDSRAIFAFTYRRKILFTVEIDIAPGRLPRWRPYIMPSDFTEDADG